MRIVLLSRELYQVPVNKRRYLNRAVLCPLTRKIKCVFSVRPSQVHVDLIKHVWTTSKLDMLHFFFLYGFRHRMLTYPFSVVACIALYKNKLSCKGRADSPIAAACFLLSNTCLIRLLWPFQYLC